MFANSKPVHQCQIYSNDHLNELCNIKKNVCSNTEMYIETKVSGVNAFGNIIKMDRYLVFNFYEHLKTKLIFAYQIAITEIPKMFKLSWQWCKILQNTKFLLF